MIATKGEYSLTANQNIDFEGGLRRFYWTIDNFDATESRKLKFDGVQIASSGLYVSPSELAVQIVVRKGEFQLERILDSNYKDLTNLHLKLTSQQGQTVAEWDQADWRVDYRFASEPLEPGSYTLGFSFSGLGQEVGSIKQFILNEQPDYEDKGLVVHAQNEAGQPLTGGQALLFVKQPYSVGYGVIGTEYYTDLTYESDKSNDGSFVIPYNELLKGRSYELEVLGTSANGLHEVVYRQAVSREDKEIRLNGSGLKHVTVTADLAKPGDSLIVSGLDDQDRLSGWPVPTPFGDNGQAELYVQSGTKLALQTKLYDANSDSGYLLSGTIDSNSDVSAVDLNGDTVELRMAAGLEHAKIDVNGYMSQDENYAKHYFITKGSQISASYYVESSGYRYTFNKQWNPINQETTIDIGRNFMNTRTDNQYFAAGELNRRVYTDYMDEQENKLVDVTITEIAKLTDSVTSEEDTFTVVDGAKQQLMTVRSDQEGGLVYGKAGTLVGLQQPAQPMTVLNYQTYDSSGHTVGNPLHAFSPTELNANLPLQVGDYALKLNAQNFPDDVIKLAGQANISVVDDGYNFNKQIKIVLPPGYTTEDVQSTESDIQKLGDPKSAGSAWIYKGILNISDPNTLDAAQKYVLHVALHLKAANGESILYYNQVVLTGSQLRELKQIDYPDDAVTTAPEVKDLPTDYSPASPEFEFSVPGSEDNGFRASVFSMSGYAGHFKVEKVIAKPQDYQIVFNGQDDSSTAYNLRRIVHVDASTGKWTIQDPGMYNMKLDVSRPFITFNSRIPGSSLNYYFYYGDDTILRNRAFVSPGKQQFAFVTETNSPEEEPWRLYWISRHSYPMDQNTVVPFTGHVDAASSSLKVAQRTEDGQVILAVEPELMSGDLQLSSISLNKGYFYSDVPGIVTIKDSHQNKIFEAVAYEWTGGFEITKAFELGTYTISYRMPVGPNDEVIVSNSFTVGAGNGNPGGSNPGDNPGGGGGPGGGPGAGIPIGGDGSDTEQPASPNTVTFKPEDIPAPVNGVVTLPIQGSEAAVLPGSMLSGASASYALELAGSNGKVSIPAAVLKQLAGLVSNDQLADAQFSLTLKPVGAKDVSGIVKPSAGTDVQAAGTVYDLKLTITPKGGAPVQLSAFNAPITVTFNVNANADEHLANVYYIAADGSLTYVPAERVNGALVAKVSHFSKYGVLEVSKTFADVSASHWAHDAIAELAAKQIVTGVTTTTFAPNKSVTRAEFTAMLVHALGLSATGSSGFKDVPAGAWYASDVAAAYEHKLIQGISAEAFAPNKSISREEMAVILANALKQLGAASSAPQATTFKDAKDISKWAAEAVNAAFANGLINGDDAGLFKPKGLATRAEAAKMLVNLLHQAAL
ncbi:S-layer homology domain-containing protein [Paenibacillus glycinis]|uniref:SLH domain-containing protein n=1 Tax=Paenibacillus glycinis TaxID=2697035 RepID=A0ABW9XSU3_9BACL|nr:S-layer homology domain-containing protein [Paenibacillus glycinis]NBD25719.1 hypothetical protein [Paenibacillus glycinis]